MTINFDHITEQIQVTDATANASLTVQPKGTGSFNVAAGSSGVNISNGGTVTALTRTANGSAYTGFPSIAISAPTTAGGVQATATPQLVAANGTVVSGGTGYTLSDVLTVTTSGGSSAITLTVTGVSGGVVTTATANSSALTTIPSGTVSVSGGTGSGATFNLLYVIAATFTITNAGSGYVEQPTVTFSGGGGSGAAAYATVGSNTIVRSIGNDLSFYTPGGEAFRVADTGAASTVNYIRANGDSATGNTPGFLSAGASGTVNLRMSTKSSGSLIFATNSNQQTQMQVTHTASAVNYVQVTGAATGSAPTISAQGSDANVNLVLARKGTGTVQVQGAFQANTNLFNNIQLAGAATGSAVAMSAIGGDTDIDLTLTPKGAGVVRFGTLTATADTAISGYITIKDSGGTLRKLAVIT